MISFGIVRFRGVGWARFRFALAFAFLLQLAFFIGPAGAYERVALVIGNNNYLHATKLQNAVADAQIVANALRSAGFHVIEAYDQDSQSLTEVTQNFVDEVEQASIGLVYFAGHGIQYQGNVYLVPVDVNLANDRDLRRTISAEYFLEDASRAKDLGVVILDACRDNPFVKQIAESTEITRAISLGRGLGRVDAVPRKTLIAYATQAGNVALDGTGANGPYANALAKHLVTPGKDVRLVFGAVRDEVLALTEGRQEPFIYGSLGADEIHLVPGDAQQASTSAGSLASLDIPNLASLGAIPGDYLLWKRANFTESWAEFDAQAAGQPSLFHAAYRLLATERASGLPPGSALRQAGQRTINLGELQNGEIAALQQALRDLNFYSGEVDGVAGPQTVNAVQQFASLEFGSSALAVATLVRLGELAATRDPAAELSGTWYGQYEYTDGPEPVKFEMNLVFSQGLISGSVIEPNTFGDASSRNLYANFTGSVSADKVRWVKKYDGTASVSHSVDYEGVLDRNTGTIVGQWTIPPSASGTFTLAVRR